MISAVILTKDEEENIKECLETLKWCDETVVIDDSSQDETRELAKKLGAKVFLRNLEGDFASQRNFGLEKASGDWVFFMDTDERISKELASEIQESVKKQNLSGYFVKRKDFMFGHWLEHGEVGNIKLLRLARKEAGEWARPVHEVWNIHGNTGELKSPLLHFPHPTVTEFLQRINVYTTLDANIFFQNGERVGFWKIVAYPTGKFISNYFFKLGFLDGIAGLLMAMIMSFHSFLTRGKIWQLQHRVIH